MDDNDVSNSLNTLTVEHSQKNEDTNKSIADKESSGSSVLMENPLNIEEGDQGEQSGDEVHNDSEDDEDLGNCEKKQEAAEKKEAELRKAREDEMTDDERKELLEQAQQLKDNGNQKFKLKLYPDAIDYYSKALSICPLCYLKERAIMYSNRAAAHMHLEQTAEAIKDCTDAIQIHPHYPKPLLRRAQTYEKTDRLDEALEDYKSLLELDGRSPEALMACQRLPGKIDERNEKLKTEMLGKLKELGNLVLNPFGLSTNNFQFQQNESGGYSVNFNQSGK